MNDNKQYMYDKTVHVRVPDEIRDELVKVSDRTGFTINTLILNCIKLQFDEVKNNAK